jgi:hypothetical protein
MSKGCPTGRWFHMSQKAKNAENNGDTIFALYGEKIEMDNGVYMGCSSSERHETINHDNTGRTYLLDCSGT